MNIPNLKVLAGLDPDIRAALIAQVRDLWTHGSTALEGNTLTLGETKFVIEEGLTVGGKPLKDHQEVVGHARAIELIYGWTEDAVSKSGMVVERARRRPSTVQRHQRWAGLRAPLPAGPRQPPGNLST